MPEPQIHSSPPGGILETPDIFFVDLGFAAVGLGLTFIFSRIGVRQVSVCVVIGAGIWLAFEVRRASNRSRCGLALEANLLDNGKIGTLAGSTISAILGCSLLLMFMLKRSEATVGVQKQQPGGKEMPGPHLSEVNEADSKRSLA